VDTFLSYSAVGGADDDSWHLGVDVPRHFAFTNDGKPRRLDMCQCEQLLRCPNGTSAPSGATMVWDCAPVGEVLRRFVPIPSDFSTSSFTLTPYGRLPNASSGILADLWDPSSSGLPLVAMRSGQTLTITLDLSTYAANLKDPLFINMTYDQDYRLAVYPSADVTPPCPPRYICNTMLDECVWPPRELQDAFGVRCSEDTSKDPPVPGCCSRPPLDPPYWLQKASITRTRQVQRNVNDTKTDIYELYPSYDNKHGLLTVSITALVDTTVLVALELLHGGYDAIFKSMAARVDYGFAEATLFEPQRAKYSVASLGDPTRPYYQFFAVIQQKDINI
jgi:hypothetical protein